MRGLSDAVSIPLRRGFAFSEVNSTAMCGRFVRSSSIREFCAHVGGLSEARAVLTASYNVAPSHALLLIRNTDAGDREWATLPWGFLPHWAKDASMRKPINARSEEVHKKPYFRDAFRHRRCLIAFDGWYEWRKLTGRKQPYFVKLAGAGPFAFAGLWDRWEPRDGAAIETCCILTSNACESLQHIHPRMPVVVKPNDYDRWLDRSITTRQPLEHVLQPYDGELQAWPVSTYVNDPANDEKQCTQPVRVDTSGGQGPGDG